MSQIPLSQIPLSQIFVEDVPLSQIPLSQIPLSQIPLSQIAHIVDCNATSACSDPQATLGDVVQHLLPGAEVAHLVGALVRHDGAGYEDLTLKDLLVSIRDMSRPEVTDTTLGDVAGNHTWADATLNEVVEHSSVTLTDIEALLDPQNSVHTSEFAALLDNTSLGLMLGFGDMTLGDVLHLMGATFFDYLVRSIIEHGAGLSLFDLLLTILPPDQFPWQEIEVAAGGIQLATGGETYRIDVTIDGQVVYDPISVTLTLPPSAVFGGADIPPTSISGNVVTWDMTVPNGISSIEVTVGESLRTGPTSTVVDVSYPEHGLTDQDSWNYTIAEVFEPNDTPGDTGIAPLADGTVYLSHISSDTDVDLYSVALAEGGSLTTHLGGIPEDQDYDLVVYGPAGTDINGFQVQSVDDDANAQQYGNDIPLLTDRPVLAVSGRRGRASERIDLTGVRAAGTYLVQVTGHQGSNSAVPYTLRSQSFGSPNLPACTARPFPNPSTVTPVAPTGLDADTRTLFLLARDRFARLYGEAALLDVEAGIAAVAAMDGALDQVDVSGAVIDLGDHASVASAFAQWDSAAGRCQVEAANDVVESIRDVVGDLRSQYPNIDSIVLVGADEVVPFARIPDLTKIANERTYAGTLAGENNELVSALAYGYYLSDNAYGDTEPDVVGGRPVWIPEVAVGRLVESPTDILAQLQHFVDFDGRLDAATTRTSVVTGYEFLSDGATRIADELDAVQDTASDRLINDTWTADDLRAILGGGEHDVISPNAHFDHYRALSAAESVAGTQADLFETSDVAGDYAGSLTFTMGCHSGFSVSDVSIGQGITGDWAQTFGAEAGTYIGNTGFGYGETETVALSELLLSQLASRLDGSMSIGDALTFAKAEYAADLSAYGVYDEKVVMEATFYGLPMYLLGGDSDAPPPAPARQLTTDPATGLQVVRDVDFDAAATPLAAQSGDNGSWYEVEGAPTGGTFTPQVTAYQPIQPRWEVDVTAHDGQGGIQTQARGVVIEGLTSAQSVAVDPAIAVPVVDSAEAQPEPVASDLAFPTTFARVANYETPAGTASQLVFVPGQFRGSSSEGTQLLFSQGDMTVYYGAPGDTAPPQIRFTEGVVDEDDNLTAGFQVTAVDAASGIARVHVLYREPGATVWQGVDLPKTEGPDADGLERFEGQVTLSSGLPAGQDLEFLVQVVDGSGLVGVSTGKAVFHTSQVGDQPPGEPTTETPATPVVSGGATVTNGWYDGDVTVTVSGDGDGDAVLRVDGVVVTPPFVVSGNGVHEVEVIDEGVTNPLWIAIDQDGPELTIESPPDGAIYPRGASVTPVVSATDEHSGVASVTHAPTVDTSVASQRTFVATAQDNAGNQTTAMNTYRVIAIDHPAQARPDVMVTVTVLGAPSGAIVDFGDGTTGVATTPATIAGESGHSVNHVWTWPDTYTISADVDGVTIDGGDIDIFDPNDRIQGSGTVLDDLTGIVNGEPALVLPTITVDARYTSTGSAIGSLHLQDGLAGVDFTADKITWVHVQGSRGQVEGVGRWPGVPGNVKFYVNVQEGTWFFPDRVRVHVYRKNRVEYDTHPGEPMSANVGELVLLGTGYNLWSTD